MSGAGSREHSIKRPRPERGAGVPNAAAALGWPAGGKPGEAGPPSESERGWGPASIRLSARGPSEAPEGSPAKPGRRVRASGGGAPRALKNDTENLDALVKELNAGVRRAPREDEHTARLRSCLVLVGGPTGSGKTTTLAALVNEINHREAKHVITIEDPIEYEHPHGRCLIEQVEIGVDAPDFPTALRAALRQAPDIIVVGEMRDPETMRIAVVAAETGHLVLSTLHTTDMASTVARIVDSFPVERQNAIRQELAMALAAVLTQILLPARNGARMPASELLMVGHGARHHIRRNNLQYLHQEIPLTKKKGSFTLEESLVTLIRNGDIQREEAQLCAIHPDDLNILLKSAAGHS